MTTDQPLKDKLSKQLRFHTKLWRHWLNLPLNLFYGNIVHRAYTNMKKFLRKYGHFFRFQRLPIPINTVEILLEGIREIGCSAKNIVFDRFPTAGNGTFPVMLELRILMLDSCSINTLHQDTFNNLGRGGGLNYPPGGWRSQGLEIFQGVVVVEY